MSGRSFGINIGEHYISIADIEAKKNSFVAESAAYNPIEFSAYAVSSHDFAVKTSEVIRKLVADAQIKKSDVNVVIPDSQSYTRIFEMPLLTDKELISAIRYQADQFIPVPIDQVSLDIHIIEKDKEASKTHILLVAAPHAIINHLVSIIEDAALIPVTIENETSAVLRLITKFNEIKGKQEGVAAYVNFGHTSTSLYLFDLVRNIPLQVHNFAIGKQIFFKDIMANYSLETNQINEILETIGFTGQQSQYNLESVLAAPYNELLGEIQRFIISSKKQTSQPVSQMYMFGEGIKFAGIDSKVQESTNIPTQMLTLDDVLEDNNVKQFFAQDWPLLVSACGASLA